VPVNPPPPASLPPSFPILWWFTASGAGHVSVTSRQCRTLLAPKMDNSVSNFQEIRSHWLPHWIGSRDESPSVNNGNPATLLEVAGGGWKEGGRVRTPIPIDRIPNQENPEIWKNRVSQTPRGETPPANYKRSVALCVCVCVCVCVWVERVIA